MIALHYPAPRPKNVSHLPAVGWDNSRYSRAQRHGLSISEYDARVQAVEDALKTLTCKVGDKVYPYTASLYHKHGAARIMAICFHYDQYGSTKWDEENPLIVQAYWEDKPNEFFNCTANYLTTNPTYQHESC